MWSRCKFLCQTPKQSRWHRSIHERHLHLINIPLSGSHSPDANRIRGGRRLIGSAVDEAGQQSPAHKNLLQTVSMTTMHSALDHPIIFNSCLVTMMLNTRTHPPHTPPPPPHSSSLLRQFVNESGKEQKEVFWKKVVREKERKLGKGHVNEGFYRCFWPDGLDP